jgi:hypothetical protein
VGWLEKAQWPLIIKALSILGEDGNSIARGLVRHLEAAEEDREALEKIIFQYWTETQAIAKLMEEFAKLYDVPKAASR